MELPEEVYEDELIDAFDAPEPEGPAPTKPLITSPQQKSANHGQPMRPKFHQTTDIPVLYPTFDDAVNVPEAPPPSKMPQQHEQIKTKELQQVGAPVQVYRDGEMMSEEELERNRRRIEREMCVYRERFDHVAQALAGETPHQILGRKKREEERLERQEKRHEAMETRLQHQIERMEEREERRARIQARHHRASRSPSPSSQEPNEDVGHGEIEQE